MYWMRRNLTTSMRIYTMSYRCYQYNSFLPWELLFDLTLFTILQCAAPHESTQHTAKEWLLHYITTRTTCGTSSLWYMPTPYRTITLSAHFQNACKPSERWSLFSGRSLLQKGLLVARPLPPTLSMGKRLRMRLEIGQMLAVFCH